MDLGIPKSYTYADPYVERSLLHGLGLNSRRASKGSLGRGIAKGIYAVYPARTRPLGSAHWKISKLFKTPPATSVLVRGWFISTIVMHGPAIQYCNTFCIRGIYGRARTYVSLSTFRGLAIETLAGLYLNRFAGRYERLLYTALCSLSRWVGRRRGREGRRYRSQLSDQNPILSRSRSSGAGVSVTLVLARIPHAFYTLHPGGIRQSEIYLWYRSSNGGITATARNACPPVFTLLQLLNCF